MRGEKGRNRIETDDRAGGATESEMYWRGDETFKDGNECEGNKGEREGKGANLPINGKRQGRELAETKGGRTKGGRMVEWKGGRKKQASVAP